MSKIFKAPEKVDVQKNEFSVFLGGSIEMDKAEKWQDALSKDLIRNFENIVIFNPRRDNWNASLENTIKNPVFKEQVAWEVDQLEKADYILLYFQPGTYSPISLLELGMFADKSKVVVCCPDGFWRKGNVEFVCEKFNIKMIDSYSDFIGFLKNKFMNS